MTVCFYTLGCKVNQNETGAMEKIFENGGYTLTQSDYADVYVINSCTVTTGGEKKSLQYLRHAKKINPNAVTVLTGCYPQAYPELAAQISEADIITGNTARNKIYDYVRQYIKNMQKIIDILPHLPNEKYEELQGQKPAGHTRAFVKIEDGCNRHCTYCVIPKARGAVRSRDEKDILNEVQQYTQSGCGEIVLTGINLSSYGQDIGSTLEDLVCKIAEISDVKRIRLGSLEPDMISEHFISTLCKVDKLCRQFHLSLQSGCDATLKRMARLYTTADFMHIMDRLRSAFIGACFTTDIIVGFVGESENDFKESIDFVEKAAFLKVNVFSYSEREGTPAAKISGQIPQNIRLKRLRIALASADITRKAIIENHLGTHAEVLLEHSVIAHTFTGYTNEYIPVLIKAQGYSVGDIVTVRLDKFDGERCAATIL